MFRLQRETVGPGPQDRKDRVAYMDPQTGPCAVLSEARGIKPGADLQRQKLQNGSLPACAAHA